MLPPDTDAHLWSDIVDLIVKRVRRGSDGRWLVLMIFMCAGLMLVDEHGFTGDGLKKLIGVALDDEPAGGEA